jgi:hypothetical protein
MQWSENWLLCSAGSERRNEARSSRTRPYRKNDSCYVEQKNYSIVRRAVGYYRCDMPQQLELLQLLYSQLRLYTNFFQPVMKLKEKIRTGSHLTRRHDEPQTPYARLLAHPNIDPELQVKMGCAWLMVKELCGSGRKSPLYEGMFLRVPPAANRTAERMSGVPMPT